MNELKYYASLAKKILNDDTKYQKDKQIISHIFNNNIEKNSIYTVIFRLTIIDSYYSTQMSMRFFGIEEVAEKIWNISEDDEKLKKCFCKYIKDPEKNKNISELFSHPNYGINKSGDPAGQAPSIISKYAYFLTDYNFPIYDSLAIESYNSIKKLYDLGELSKKNYDNFFINISELKKKSEIETFDDLDNLLWLMGKVKNGSFSLILDKKKYCKLITLVNPGYLFSWEENDNVRLINLDEEKFDWGKKVNKAINESKNNSLLLTLNDEKTKVITKIDKDYKLKTKTEKNKLNIYANLESEEIDEKIREYLKDNLDKLTKIFPEETIEFLDFCYNNIDMKM